MLRRNPLTILLLIATIVVDIVFVTVRLPGGLDKRALFAGLLFGQMAACAIWAARGSSGHRLGRGSLLVIAACLIGLASGGSALLGRYQWLAILVGYTLTVYGATVLLAFAQKYTSQKSEDSPAEPTWQVSIIELFGWTILVAIASFAARSMEFGFIRLDNHIIEKVVLLLALPLTLATFIRKDLGDLSQGKAATIVLVVLTVVIAYLLRTRDPNIALPLIFGQGGYLVLWFLVLGMDRLVRQAQGTEEQVARFAPPPEQAEDSQQLDP